MPKYKKEGQRKRNWEIRREEAIERQEQYNLLTPEAKIHRLDFKLGKGVGAVKQRSKLKLQL